MSASEGQASSEPPAPPSTEAHPPTGLASDAHRGDSGSTSPAARESVQRALWRMMSFYGTPLADLDEASQHDPAWPLPHLMRAGFLYSLTEPALLADADAALETATALSNAASSSAFPAHERAHAVAIEHVAAGRWQAACRVWDESLLDRPHDALALQWAQLWDFYRGDAAGLRGRPARALAAWHEDDALYPCVLALWAFGLEENHRWAEAEEAARRALSLDPRVPWAVHTVAHTMEMQGRFEEGSAWLRSQQTHWAEGNGFSVHLWWHKGLFRLEALDVAGALRIVDGHLSGAEQIRIGLQRIDAASMLWRLHLMDTDVQAHARALVADWPAEPAHAGHYAFNDWHYVLALLVADERTAAEAWLARCAEQAMKPEDGARSNHTMAREVGLPLMRGVLALHAGDAAAAGEALYPVRAIAQRFGGSHAQRDLIDQTLIAAGCAPNGRRAIARALLDERLLAKPATPLTRWWLQQLGATAS
jgi:tetratricopeptide (TPR) repeat protein